MPNLLERRLEDQHFCDALSNRFGDALDVFVGTSNPRRMYKATYDVIMLVYFGKNAPRIDLGKPIKMDSGDYEQIQTLQDISVAVAEHQDEKTGELFEKLRPELGDEKTAAPAGHSDEVYTVVTSYGIRLHEYVKTLHDEKRYDHPARTKVTSAIGDLVTGFMESDRPRLWKAHLILPNELPDKNLLQRLV